MNLFSLIGVDSKIEMNDNLKKFERNPYKSTFPNYLKEPILYPSHDKRYSIILTHCWEWAKDCDCFLFALIDEKEQILENFEPLVSRRHILWSQNSRYVIIPVGQSNSGFLIYDVQESTFGLIKFKRIGLIDISTTENEIVLGYPASQIKSLNDATLFGGGENGLPRKKYLKPEDLSIPFDKIKLHTKSSLATIFDIEKTLYSLEPIENGFHEFNGRLPSNTKDGFNRREFQVYQLEAFAEYGDEQSIKWLNEIIKKTSNNYSRWKNVSEYIGFKKRKTTSSNAYSSLRRLVMSSLGLISKS